MQHWLKPIGHARGKLPPDYLRVKAVVGSAFAHRRKQLPNSLELAGIASRAEAAAGLRAIGRGAETHGVVSGAGHTASAAARPEAVERC